VGVGGCVCECVVSNVQCRGVTSRNIRNVKLNSKLTARRFKRTIPVMHYACVACVWRACGVRVCVRVTRAGCVCVGVRVIVWYVCRFLVVILTFFY
jgi:hypothetical protein